jgi:hypothetical protein
VLAFRICVQTSCNGSVLFISSKEANDREFLCFLINKSFITKLNPSSQTVFVVASLERASQSYPCSPVVSLGQATERMSVGEELEANVSRFWKNCGRMLERIKERCHPLCDFQPRSVVLLSAVLCSRT